MTTEEEHRILKVFKELYPEFPFGNIEKYESPDFILKTKNQTIGIELTEAFQEENLQKTSSTKAKFLDILIDQIQSKYRLLSLLIFALTHPIL